MPMHKASAKPMVTKNLTMFSINPFSGTSTPSQFSVARCLLPHKGTDLFLRSVHKGRSHVLCKLFCKYTRIDAYCRCNA